MNGSYYFITDTLNYFKYIIACKGERERDLTVKEMREV